MTNLPSLLKEAILEQDWSKVNSVYELLTGKSVPTEQIVDAQFPSDEVEQDSHIAKAHEGDDFSSKGAGRREPLDLTDRQPRWTDDGSIAAEEMVSKNPSLGVSNPVARNRKPAAKQQNSKSSDIRLDKSPRLKDE